MNIERKERGQYPDGAGGLPAHALPCTATTLPASRTTAAVYKREDGLVIIDPVKAKGRTEIVGSCPYGVIYWNEESAARRRSAPAAPTCWTRAGRRPAARRSARPRPSSWSWPRTTRWRPRRPPKAWKCYRAELGTKPRVYYKNLHRWTKVFVAGSVVDEAPTSVPRGSRLSCPSTAGRSAGRRPTTTAPF